MIRERINFENRDHLAKALALKTAQCLSHGISKNGNAMIAVSGGTTPRLFFEHLSHSEITWDKVTITLVDERQVPQDHPRSNAGFVKSVLLQNRAQPARFLPLYPKPTDLKDVVFDCTILGMGNDGHTASFFPGGDTLQQAIDPDGKDAVLSISAPGSGEPRLTFTLPWLIASCYLALHIEGQEKRAVLERAIQGTDPFELPIRSVLNASKPLDVYWCP
jgi:6-phosphogluconolactonase